MMKVFLKRWGWVSLGCLTSLKSGYGIESVREERPWGAFPYGQTQPVPIPGRKDIHQSTQQFKKLNNSAPVLLTSNGRPESPFGPKSPIGDSTSSEEDTRDAAHFHHNKQKEKKLYSSSYNSRNSRSSYNSPNFPLKQEESDESDENTKSERIIQGAEKSNQFIQEGFLKFFQEEIGHEIPIMAVPAFDFLAEVEASMKDHFQIFEKDLISMFGTTESPIHTYTGTGRVEPSNENLEDLTTIGKIFKERIDRISISYGRLGKFENNKNIEDIEPYGMVHYTRKIFEIFYKYCQPRKKDDIAIWEKKKNIIILNFSNYISQFEKRVELRERIQQEAAFILINFYKESCDYIHDYFRGRFVVIKYLTGAQWRNATTTSVFEEFSRNFKTSFSFLYVEEKKSKRSLEACETKTLGDFKLIDKEIAELPTTEVAMTAVVEGVTKLVTYIPPSVTTGVTSVVTGAYSYCSSWGTTTTTPAIKPGDPQQSPAAKKGWGLGWY